MSFRPQHQRSGGIHHVGERTNTGSNRPLGKIPRLALLPRNDMSGGWFRSTPQVVFGTWMAADLPPLHCVVSFNRTGDHCNVDGGRLPPLHCVVSFNRTGYHCNVAGGRLPPLRQCTTFFLFYRHKTRIDSSKMCCFATNAIRPCLYPMRAITSVRLSHRAVARVRSS